MPAPDVTVSIQDGALRQLTTGSGAIRAKVGTAASGTAASVVTINSLDDARTAFTAGPLVEALAFDLAINGGPLLAVRVTGSVAGTIGSITSVGGGTAPTATGTPNDSYEVLVTITTGGAVGTAQFTFSLDGGSTTQGPFVTAATYAVSDPLGVATGITLAFGAGTYTASSTHRFRTFAPHYGASDLNAAIDALLADSRAWPLLHVVGANMASVDATNAAAAATLASAVATRSTNAANAFRYARFLMDGPDAASGTQDATWDTAVYSAFSAFTSSRVSISHGHIEHVSPVTGLLRRRAGMWPIFARASTNAINTAQANDPAWVGAGPLDGQITRLFRDERVQNTAHDARFMALRTHIGRRGFFAASSITMAATGSDYAYLPNGTVMDVFATVARDAALDFASVAVRVNPNGTIYEVDAVNIERAISARVSEALVATDLISPPTQSTPLIRVDRTNNVLSTSRIIIRGRATPKGYGRNISVDLGYTRVSVAA